MKALLAMMLVGVALCLSIGVMIYGYGVHPQNWLIVIGGSLLVMFLSALSNAVASL